MTLSDEASSRWVWKAVALAAFVILLLYLLGWMLGRVLGPLRIVGQSITCQGNVFQLSRGMRLYADDYDDRLPPAREWMDRVVPYTKGERTLRCPAVGRPDGTRYGYAMNGAFAGRAKSRIERPERVPLVFDSTRLERNAVDTVASLPVPGRHRTAATRERPSRKGNFVGYADGSGRFRPDAPAPAPR